MANARMPDEFFDTVAHHLPPEQPVGPKGGRPRVGHRVVIRVIWFVLDHRRPLGGRPAGTRLLRPDRPPPAPGLGGGRHLGPPARRPAGGAEAGRQARPRHGDHRRRHRAGLRRRRGDRPQPRRPPETRHEAHGHGQQGGRPAGHPHRRGERQRPPPDPPGDPRLPPGRRACRAAPRSCPTRRTPTGATTASRSRALLRWLGIEPHIAKRRTPHGSGLGKVRWVVERTISWLKGLRRLRVRYDRLGVIMDAWTTLAASVICFRILHHDAM